MYAVALPALVIWLVYGISINNMALIVSNVIAVIGCASIIIEYFVYKK